MASELTTTSTTSPRAHAWLVVGLMMAIAGISHFNRISISTAGQASIMPGYGISPERMGWVYSAFLFTYTALMVPGGWVIDRVGAKRALLGVLLGSALFVMLTGVVGMVASDGETVFLSLLLIRGLMGMTSAPLHPALARMTSQWAAPANRSRTNGLVNSAALVGIAATPVLFGGMIDAFGWPRAFLAAGAATATLAVFWALLVSGRAPYTDRPALEDESGAPTTWLDLLGDRSLILLTISYGAVGYFQYLFFYWMNYYFEDVLRLATERSRVSIAIVSLSMALGMGLGGWLSSRFERRFGARRGARIVPMGGLAAGAVLLGLGVSATSPEWIVLWFALAMGAVGASEGPFWAAAVELGGRRGGSSAAVLNFGGNLGGLLAPILTPWIGQRHGWPAAVAVGGLACVVGLLLWLGIETGPKAKPAKSPPPGGRK